ncbi:tyrosine-type recombinase/integrase [Escherichia coli]|uniref:tyrosine-type recombinase/integrase n=1 Tax=Escherichia coli TaxID=562 RepID=UPI001409608F|nr:tyrosine-type recombinase/integrase [Escherichia coli]EFB3642923.1 tyrosine-type recombinase/integrase [Escherichia coli]EFO5333913.1 tyrosine-type recombinase/integrase [Escherichia coli]EFO5647135.1 tyrosine-type recombinase/integrase [Escherichia coli]EHQ8971690.1 tyrosine-type recombinase/integrase [Escherichia coli]EIY2726529.1 tyrosine-type recombinase/integrase [Escherichia coli]
MSKLIISGNPGMFLRDIGAEYQEAAKNFMQFLNDQGAYSPNTLRDLRLVFHSWARWCHARGLAWFPISPEAAREYLLQLHDADLASTTIEKHYAMLNMLLSQCGLPQLSDDKSVSLAMRRIRREAATEKGERTGQAVPLRWDDLKLLDVLLSRSDRLVDLRNRAFLFLAYNTLLRMAEMSRVRVRDLEQTGDTVTLHVSHTKTITTAAGLDKVLSRRTTAVLNDWLDASGLRDHPDAILFPPVHRNNKARITTTPLTAPAMEKIFSDAWALLGKSDATPNKGRYRTWTGHSARVGAAIDMAEKQVSLVEIMQEGTWKKPETLMRYLRRGGVTAGANSRLMDS